MKSWKTSLGGSVYLSKRRLTGDIQHKPQCKEQKPGNRWLLRLRGKSRVEMRCKVLIVKC